MAIELNLEYEIEKLSVKLDLGYEVEENPYVIKLDLGYDALENPAFFQIKNLVPTTNAYCACHLENGIILIGGYPSGVIWRSTDDGATWSVTQKLHDTDTDVSSVLDFAYLGGGVVVCGTNGDPAGQIWRSTDYGKTWGYIQDLGTSGIVMCLSYVGGGVVVAGLSENSSIYRSVNYGISWSFVQDLEGAGNPTVFDLTSPSAGVCVAILGPNGSDIWRSGNYGATWSVIQRIGSELFGYSLASYNGHVIAGAGAAGIIATSDNGGLSWTERRGLGSYIVGLCMNSSGVAYAGLMYPSVKGTVWKSTDYGFTWDIVQHDYDSPVQYNSIPFFVKQNGVVLSVTGGVTAAIWQSPKNDVRLGLEYSIYSIHSVIELDLGYDIETIPGTIIELDLEYVVVPPLNIDVSITKRVLNMSVEERELNMSIVKRALTLEVIK